MSSRWPDISANSPWRSRQIASRSSSSNWCRGIKFVLGSDRIADAASECQLAGVECLGEAAWRIAFHAAQAHQAAEGVGGEPGARPLRRKRLQQRTDLPVDHRLRQRHVQVRLTQIAVVLRDLVLEDQVVAKSVPGKLREDAMILVSILEAMRQDDIGVEVRFQHLEAILDFGPMPRKVAAAERMDLERELPWAQQARESGFGLPAALALRREHGAMEPDLRVGGPPALQRPAAADLDVVAVRAEAQHGARLGLHAKLDPRLGTHDAVARRSGRV